MSDVFFHDVRVLTLSKGAVPRRGSDAGELGVIERGYVMIRDGRVAAVGACPRPKSLQFAEDTRAIDGRNRVLMPAFVDCHTHACWAGQRYDEFEMKLRGATYLDILNAGGGIMSTVRAVRSASEDELAELLLIRLARMRALGTGTVEVKSGYGLDTETELKMLRAIRLGASQTSQRIIPTFLGAHAIDRDNPDFVEETIAETLPAVAEEFPGIVCDAYCEEGAWSLEETRQLFERAMDLGCPIRVHADQFNPLGATRLAIEMGAVSVDHLEATMDDDLRALAESEAAGVMLPCSGFQLDDRYADGRGFLDCGGWLAIATNYNPGSAPTPSIPFTIALACRKLGLTPAEAITCATINAARVLQLDDEVGSIETGKRADLQLLDATDEREPGYEFATAGPVLVVSNGDVVHERDIVLESGMRKSAPTIRR